MKKKIMGCLLAITFVGGLVTTSRAQAATIRTVTARHDAYTAHVGLSEKAPAEPQVALDLVVHGAELAYALWQAWKAYKGGVEVSARAMPLRESDRVFDQVPAVR